MQRVARVRGQARQVHESGRGQLRDPGRPLAQYFETGATKRLGYSNPRADELFGQARAAFDPNERKKILAEIQNLLTEEAPAAFMWRQKLQWGIAKNIEWTPRTDEAIYASEIRVKN